MSLALRPRLSHRRLTRCILTLIVLGCSALQLLALEVDFRITAEAEELCFEWTLTPEQRQALPLFPEVHIRALPAHTQPDSQSPARLLWKGSASLGSLRLPRFDASDDLLFSKFELSVGTPPYSQRWVTDFDPRLRRSQALAPVDSKKGITCLLDVNDGRVLGCRQLNQNILINALLDLESAKPSLSFTYQGRTIGLHPKAVEALDRDLRAAHANGQRVTGILLNSVSKHSPPNSPLIHPLTPRETVPIGPAAFNTATTEGVFLFRAIVHWLVERYTRQDAPFGTLAALVIGNEMQSHWSWYHLGHADPETVIAEYTRALRLADLASRDVHTTFKVFVSLDHHWAFSASEHPQKGFSGLEALEEINRQAKAEGDFPWALAFHPYPENLFNPAFWNDRSAPLRLDAPRVTFHNLEVLPAFLRQPHFLYRGTARSIALTEQGFHCPDGAEGETLQAAAYALAWKKVSQIREIESFLYHRHVDHPHEHGLHCGIRKHDGSANVNGVGQPRKIHEVMRAAGSPQEDEAFAFALPILGRTDWTRAIAPSVQPPKAARRQPESVWMDLLHASEGAVPENLQSVQRRRIGAPNEVTVQGVLLHPKPKGRGRWIFKSLRLPEVDQGPCHLNFELLLDNAQGRGAAFFVEINGTEIFSKKLQPAERFNHAVDLSPWSGQSVDLALGVDALADPAYDWCVWMEPRIVLSSPKWPRR